jgi:hydrogenase nickel incorporation protein HypA/HybF
MHELSIAMSILDLVAEEAERRNGRVVAVYLKLGPLSGVVKPALVWAYDLAREDTVSAAAELVVQDVAVTAQCPACDTVREPARWQELVCPVCGASLGDIETGRELEVVALEIES